MGERSASPLTLETTLPSQPSVLKAVYFYPAHFSIHMTGWTAKMICLHSCHVSGPFINSQVPEFMNGTSVPVSLYAGVTHKGKGVALASRATWETVVNLTCAIWKHNPPLPTLWEITFPPCPQLAPRAPLTPLYVGV